MTSVVLIVHLLVAVGLVCLVLMQRSEGGALGMGGGSSSLISGRGAADVLARGTAILAGVFLITSISLTVMAGGARHQASVIDDAPKPSILDTFFPKTVAPPVKAPAPAPVVPVLPAPATDVVPSPAETMQRAGPLEGPTVATLPPVSSAPAAKIAAPLAPVSAAKPATTVSSAKPATPAASSTKPAVVAATSSAKPAATAVSGAKPKPPVHSSTAASGAESGQPAPPPSRAGPDE